MSTFQCTRKNNRATKMRTSLAICVFCLPISVLADNLLPEKYVGLWATEDSVLEGMALRGGQVIYLDKDGEGAVVGAPLPVQKCGDKFCAPIIGIKIHAALQPDGQSIIASVTDYGERRLEQGFLYDEKGKVLIAQSGPEKGTRYSRRFAELPQTVRAMLHETPKK